MAGLSDTPGLADGEGLSWLLDGLGSAGLTIGVPVNTVPPEIDGTPEVGQTLTVVPGTWTSGNQPITLTYQWRLDGIDIPGETEDTLVLGAETEGGLITVVEIATNIVGFSSLASEAVGPVTT